MGQRALLSGNRNEGYRPPRPPAGIKIKNGNPSYTAAQSSVKAYQYVTPESLQRDVPFLQRFIPASIVESLEVLNLDVNDVDHYIFGQQFAGLTMSWIHNLGIDGARVFDTLKHEHHQYPNCVLLLLRRYKLASGL